MTKETMARHLWMDAVIAHVVSKKCDPSRLLAGKGALRDRLNRAYAMGESVWMAGDEMVFRLKQGAIHDRADREARALSGLVSKARKNRTASLRRGAKRSKHLRRKTARTRLRKRISRRGRAMSLPRTLADVEGGVRREQQVARGYGVHATDTYATDSGPEHKCGGTLWTYKVTSLVNGTRDVFPKCASCLKNDRVFEVGDGDYTIQDIKRAHEHALRR